MPVYLSEQAKETSKQCHQGAKTPLLLKQKRVKKKRPNIAKGPRHSIAQLQIKPNNTGLPDTLKMGMERLSGISLDHVKVHYNSSKPAAFQAHAYAQGSDIHLSAGQEKHLPHELSHVVQQAQGRVRPTTSIGGMAVNDNAGLEKEADMMGAKALQMKASRHQLEKQPETLMHFQTPCRQLYRTVIQLKSLNGILLDETVPYPNNNQAAILMHMAGEWDGINGHAVDGGHLLSTMEQLYGPAVAKSMPNGESAAGVHFAGGLPGDRITAHQHRFKLVKNNPGGGARRVSASKDSTFWPRSWSSNNLVNTLNHSYRNGNATDWASKQNTSYWYRWQTLGANTLFPIERITRITGSDRNKMKEGRARALDY
ncbi:DUF4157 domain-containing protein [uncultured Shewanella sp.]|uniref:eCIS core domain-containing protein n=1 Tax=uncultured Shewanella sp. TaxID=173975 RepID=UPI00262E416E|nr:DUF4157 domain-containing protein [uncultured Shewanella sp.]